MRKENAELINLITRRFKQQNEMMDALKTVTTSAEETLLNVLTAIRQTEFLQAWCPAQDGYKEMMIVGRHPSNILEKAE